MTSNTNCIIAARLETFELEILGGAVERQFRSRCPHIERMPWGTLDVSAFSADELIASRRGWSDLALQEYSAAASLANMLRLLVRARAPIDLSAMLTIFPLDELAHTELCVRMAEELGGAALVEYPTEEVFPTQKTIESGSPLVEAAKAVVWECCVGETLSHGILEFHRRNAAQPLLKAVWGRLAKDEAAHARFGWIFMGWAKNMLTEGERKEVAAHAERAVSMVEALHDKARHAPDEAFVNVGVFGARGRAGYIEESQAILEENVVKRLRSLLSSDAFHQSAHRGQ